MTYHVSRRELDENCLNYKQQFSRTSNGRTIQENALPSPAKRKATKATESVWMQTMSKTATVTYGEDLAVLNSRNRLSRAEEEALETPKGIVHLNREGIEMAIDRRIALFFQQAIVCYKMPFYFKSVGADEQFGSSEAIKYSRVTHKRQAAHSSTFPHLIAYPKDKTAEEGFNFLKGGFYEAQQNQTIGMHVYVNNTDSALDGGDGDGKLRDRALEIINEVADGLSPVEATKRFMEVMIEETSRLMEQWEDSASLAEQTKYRVAKKYKKLTQESLQESNNSYFFDGLIGCKTTNTTNDKIRSLIFKKRYHLFQFQETTECKIAKLIHDVKMQMPVRERNMVEHMLLLHFSEKSERIVIEKLLAKSCAPFDEDYQAIPDKEENPKAYKTFLTRVKNLREKHKALMSRLERDLRPEFRQLVCAEATMRSKVFKQVRVDIKQWTAAKFCSELLRKTDRSVSKSWVNRVEQLSRMSTKNEADYKTPLSQRRRYLTIQEAKDSAKAFNVDEGLFLAAMITSE